MHVAPGARLGPYTVVALLGKGGMGEVYRAHDARLGRDVAIKVLPTSMASDPAALARFEREARAVAALNHPAIVALHDIGTQDDVAYVVTELLAGETLRDRLDRDGPIPPRRALAIATQVAQGLGAAHARGIVHRDVKPENLFLLDDGRVKVLDFGIARQLPADPALQATVLTTQPGIIMGTVGYLAPEVVRSEAATPQSDMFAFGLVVYEMLAGANPFLRETVAETVSAVLRDEPPPLGRAVPSLAPAAARLVHRCLEQRPEDRPDSLRDVAFHLESLNSDVPAGLPHQAGSNGDVAQVRRWLLAAVTAVVLALTAGTHTYLARSEAGPGRDPQRMERAVVRAQQARLRELRLTARLLASSPIVKAGLGTRDGPTVLVSLQEVQPSANVPLLVALDVDGRVLANTNGQSLGPGDAEAFDTLRRSPNGAVVHFGGRPHHAASMPAGVGDTIFGVIVAAAPVGDAFARSLGEAVEGDVLLLDAGGLRGSTVRDGTAPWRSLDAWRQDGGAPGSERAVRIGAQAFAAREIALVPDGELSAVVLTPEATAAAYQRVRPGLLAIAGLVLLLGAALSWWLPGVLMGVGQRS